ncbi:MAG: hypothetical protein R3F43_12220 [bacterium]
MATARPGRPATDILVQGHHTNTDDIAEERYLALRDVIRTRELLVKGAIPAAAIHRQPQGMTLLGIGSVGGAQQNRVPALIAALPPLVQGWVQRNDVLNFVDPHTQRRWVVYEFASAAACQTAYNQLVVENVNQVKVRFQKFGPIRPLGMV